MMPRMASVLPQVISAPERIPPRVRRITSATLVILAGILAFASVFAIWADRQVSENRAWRDIAERLIEDPGVRELLSEQLTDQIYQRVDVSEQLRRALPDRLSLLADPAAGMLREQVEERVNDALGRPAVQRAFVNAVGTAHTAAMSILDGDDALAVHADGTVTLDLRSVLVDVADRVGFGSLAESNLPADAASIELIRSSELESAQTALRILRKLSIALPILTLLCVVGALWIAAGRRRETLRLLGVVLLIAAILVPVVRSMAGTQVLGAVDAAPAAQDAAATVWEAGTSLLTAGGRSLLVYAVAVLAAALLAGPARGAVWIRRRLRAFTEPQWAYPIGALILVAVLWWGPTQTLRRWLPALILLVLLAVGLEALRRQIMREALADGAAPSAPDLRGAVAGLGAGIGRLRRRRGAGDATAQLERLSQLHSAGELTDQEYDAAKRRVLGGDAGD